MTLTPLGAKPHARIEAMRADIGRRLSAYMADYSEGELATVTRFIHDLHSFVRQSMTMLSNSQGGPQ